MNIQTRLTQLGLVLPSAPKPVAVYVPAVQQGNLLYISGQLPMLDGKLMAIGRVPSQVSLQTAQAAAKQCALNALAIINDTLAGDWSRFERIVRVGVFVACDDDFAQQPQVANGASELLGELLGDAGRHARAAVGVNALPLGAPVEVELIVALR